MTPPDPRDLGLDPNRLRHAEDALRRLGYARVAPVTGSLPGPEFWVQESGVPRRRFPVFLGPTGILRARTGSAAEAPAAQRAIIVVPNEQAAEDAWRSMLSDATADLDRELSVLVVPARSTPPKEAHWHARLLDRSDLLRLATGVVVGMFRRAEKGDGPVDFGEMLRILRRRFSVDVHRSLGVTEDEDALFLLYQMAQRFTWAPGDGGSNLHALVLKPTGPAARLPWFAA